MTEYVLAFDFGGTKTAVAIADLSRTILLRETFATEAVEGAVGVLQKAISIGELLCDRAQKRASSARLCAIGVSSMGITLRDRVEMAPNVQGWGQLRIEDAIRHAFGDHPVYIENDVKTATLAELRQGALKGTSVGMYVNIGTGIAIGYTLGDQVIRGCHGAAGEIAYNLLHKDEARGFASGVAPLEEFAGGRGIGQRATLCFGHVMSAKEVFDRAATDGQVRAFRDEVLQVLASHVTNAVIQWDPEKVVVGGGMVAAKDDIFPYFRRYFSEFVPFPPILEESVFESGASIYGAIELALDAMRTSRKGISI